MYKRRIYDGSKPEMRRKAALLLCLGIYVVALLTAMLSVRLMRGGNPVFVALVADIIATVTVFAFSMIFDNSSFYDPYWSVAPPLIAVYWLAARGLPDVVPIRSLVVIGLVLLWAFRLTFNWTRQWGGLKHEDWRYRGFRERFGALYWPVSFFGIHLFPTLIVFLGCLSLYPVMAFRSARPLGVLDALAAIVTLAAIVVETTADRQLHRFKKDTNKPGAILNSGVWARCRHPNYLGEILFWWGLYVFCLAASPDRWWFVIGPLAMTGLFLGISVPLMDRHLRARKAGYAEHIQRVPALFPRLFGRQATTGTAKQD
jgi:steroid 5-alpha reductase family enzyme